MAIENKILFDDYNSEAGGVKGMFIKIRVDKPFTILGAGFQFFYLPSGTTRWQLRDSNFNVISSRSVTVGSGSVNAMQWADFTGKYTLEPGKDYYVGVLSDSGTVWLRTKAGVGTDNVVNIDGVDVTGYKQLYGYAGTVIDSTSGLHAGIKGEFGNAAPTLTLATTDNRTLYENDQFNVTGQVTDTDVGNVVTTKFSINGGTERAITATISQGTALTYNKVLTFKQGKLFDGTTAITDTLADGSQHVLRVWAEDDKGGKSAEQVRVFYVVANRSAVLTINPVTSVSDLIDSDTIAISGNVSDPDGNTVTVRYKIGNGLYTQVYSGTGGVFSFNVALADLQTGVNTVMVQATDSYGLSTTKTLRVTKNANNKPLLKSVATYKLTPPNGSADGIVLWVQRETGDLIVNAEISMGANGAEENFVPMVKESTAYVTDAIEEDEFTFDNDAVSAENIVVRLTMERTSASSGNGIKLISGVLS